MSGFSDISNLNPECRSRFPLVGLAPVDDRGSIGLSATAADRPIDTEKTSIGVTDKAKVSALPAELGGGAGYLVGPTAKSASGLALGWDTVPLGAAGHDKFTFRFNYTGPKGGRIGVYTIGEDAKPVPVLNTGKLTMNPGDSEGSDNAKANDKLILTKTEKNAPIWAFSAPGTYTLTATAVAANTVQSRFSGRTAPLSVTFKVGDRSISGDEPAAPGGEPGSSSGPSTGDEGGSDSSDEAAPGSSDTPSAPNEDGSSEPGAPRLDIDTTLKPGDSLDTWAEGFSEGSEVEFLIGDTVIGKKTVVDGAAVAHSVFPGLAIAFLVSGSLVLGGAIAGVATAVLVALLSQNRRLKEDSVIGVLFVGAFALGVVVIARTPGYAGSLQDFLFGSITGVPASDVPVAIGGSILVLALLALLHRPIVAVSLDRETARASGLPIVLLDVALYVAVSLAVVLSVQTIGNVLVLTVGFALAWLLVPRHGLLGRRLGRRRESTRATLAVWGRVGPAKTMTVRNRLR